MGRAVGPKVAARFGKRILGSGGNNAMVVTPAADLDLAVRAIVFSAVGTAGQRCTSLRRLIVHRDVKQPLLDRLLPAYRSLRIGNPLQPDTLVGPLINEASFEALQHSLSQALKDGGHLLMGGQRRLEHQFPQGFYVAPAIVDMPAQTSIVRHETFAPLLYVLSYDEPGAGHCAQQRCASGPVILHLLQRFARGGSLSERGRFGLRNGQCQYRAQRCRDRRRLWRRKETGGDRESGSDAWKQYMRRTTNTINYSRELPLAQGIQFG